MTGNDAAYTPDLFAPTHPVAPNQLDAAHFAYEQRQTRLGRARFWWLALLVLLSLNAVLWLTFTRHQSVWADGGEALAQADIEPQKISLPNEPKPEPKLATQSEVNTETKPPSLQALPMAVASVAAAPSESQPSATMPEKTECVAWMFFNSGDIKRAQKRLSDAGWGGYKDEMAEEPATYMVYLGPFDSRAALDAKLKAIVSMKLSDYSAMPNNSISLGVLSSEQAAKALAQSLTQRGLTGVQWMERTGGNKRLRYRFESLNAAGQTSLNSLAVGLGILKPCV
jgi:hypothetical protein